MKLTIELPTQLTDTDAAALAAWLDMQLRDQGHPPNRITWTNPTQHGNLPH